MNKEERKPQIRLKPVGIAHQTGNPDIMRVEIFKEYADGLEGIEQHTHINVLYWMHKLTREDRKRLKVHPRADLTKPLTGVFALRSPMRPNPIGLTRVELTKKEGNTLFVRGLDALDGTPVIDIKSNWQTRKNKYTKTHGTT
jgi:tRNA-Thr(GGU) m(6)t(6)A37 methyltransferase TsaA